MTLAEVLIAITIVLILAAALSAMISQMNQAWISGQQRVETYQNGRAILELMARELAPAVISNQLQFVQGPVAPGKTNLNALLPALAGTGTATQTVNSDSLFWARPGPANAIGNIYETGYLLTTYTPTSGAKKYQLVRFFMGPDNIATAETTANLHATSTLYSSGSYYWIYDPPTAYVSTASFTYSTAWPDYADAPWVTRLSSFSPYSTSTTTLPAAPGTYGVVSDGVLAFWIRCLDKNGDPIPWLYQSSYYSSSFANTPNIKFNSAAAFSPAILGQSIATTGTSSFTYAMPPTDLVLGISSGANTIKTNAANTSPANRLPTAVEVTIITVDSRTLARNPTIPAIPASTSATDVPNEIQNYMNSLIANHITTARVFSTTVRLVNGTD